MIWNLIKLARLLGEFHGNFGDIEKSNEYQSIWEEKVALIEEILYDENSKSYFDLNLENGKLNMNYFASNYVPLYFYSKSGFPPNVDSNERKADLLASLRIVFTDKKSDFAHFLAPSSMTKELKFRKAKEALFLALYLVF